ncbi:uncharacterized protein LOC126903106 isoform X2 [Daktulosphaira vitifoliae]|uniref:uncharacterized protein LOC126903106 isoform X2 n=1 Tax=Daktulosphaira vitifoliae TaxID=58002 RepID=UPI0021AA1A8B|nr:uncharacterized protein LOC126903106 isoform X2 [Daktulosphaira vitifoliae]
MGLHFVKLSSFCFILLTFVSVMNANNSTRQKLKDDEIGKICLKIIQDVTCSKSNRDINLIFCNVCKTPIWETYDDYSYTFSLRYCPTCLFKPIVESHDSSVEEPVIMNTVNASYNDIQPGNSGSVQNYCAGLKETVSYREFLKPSNKENDDNQ